MGGICSFSTAARLTSARGVNSIVRALTGCRAGPDRRLRYPADLRVEMYGFLLSAIRGRASRIELGLCLEERDVWQRAGLDHERVRCNCIWGERVMGRT